MSAIKINPADLYRLHPVGVVRTSAILEFAQIAVSTGPDSNIFLEVADEYTATNIRNSSYTDDYRMKTPGLYPQNIEHPGIETYTNIFKFPNANVESGGVSVINADTPNLCKGSCNAGYECVLPDPFGNIRAAEELKQYFCIIPFTKFNLPYAFAPVNPVEIYIAGLHQVSNYELLTYEVKKGLRRIRRTIRREFEWMAGEWALSMNCISSSINSIFYKKSSIHIRRTFKEFFIRDIRRIFRQTVQTLFKNLPDFSGCEEDARIAADSRRNSILHLIIPEKSCITQINYLKPLTTSLTRSNIN